MQGGATLDEAVAGFHQDRYRPDEAVATITGCRHRRNVYASQELGTGEHPQRVDRGGVVQHISRDNLRERQ